MSFVAHLGGGKICARSLALYPGPTWTIGPIRYVHTHSIGTGQAASYRTSGGRRPRCGRPWAHAPYMGLKAQKGGGYECAATTPDSAAHAGWRQSRAERSTHASTTCVDEEGNHDEEEGGPRRLGRCSRTRPPAAVAVGDRSQHGCGRVRGRVDACGQQARPRVSAL